MAKRATKSKMNKFCKRPFLPSIILLTIVIAGTLFSGCAGENIAMQERLRQLPPEKRLIAASDDYVILIAQKQDTLQSLAKQFLGSPYRDWSIADFNQLRELGSGQEVIIPLKPQNPGGIYPLGYQTVPILAYHHFGNKVNTTTLSPSTFEAQMAYLNTHGYRVIRLIDLQDFLRGRAALPSKSVVITIDDGYNSAYTIAYPILKKYQFPATFFIYSDFTNLKSGMRWEQMREMLRSNLIDIQPHSKTHSNLVMRSDDEAPAAYAHRIAQEISHPARLIQQKLRIPIHTFSYPYGDMNDVVIAQLQQYHYHMAVTVQRGGNAFFANPFMLHRTLVYGDRTLDDFKTSLEIFRWTGKATDPQTRPKHRLDASFPWCIMCKYTPASLIPGHREKALAFEQDGHLAAARIQWNILQTLAPDDPEIRTKLTAITARMQQQVKTYLHQGKRAFRKQQYRRAKRIFLAALALNPLQSVSHTHLQMIEEHMLKKKRNRPQNARPLIRRYQTRVSIETRHTWVAEGTHIVKGLDCIGLQHIKSWCLTNTSGGNL